MGVYLKGATIPTDCYLCPCYQCADCFCKLANEYTPITGRPDFCPLQEIEDTTHQCGPIMQQAEPMEEHPEAAEGDRKLINADRLIIDILDSPKIETNTIPGLIKIIYKQPAVEAEPKRGQWQYVYKWAGSQPCGVCCPFCESEYKIITRYCPNCGARMEE